MPGLRLLSHQPSQSAQLTSPERVDARRSILYASNVNEAVLKIDLIPSKFNLYTETLENLGHKDKSFSPKPPSQYAVTLRARNGLPKRGWQLESWAYELKVGKSLPPLPIWLDEKHALMLDLDATYEQTLKELRLTKS